MNNRQNIVPGAAVRGVASGVLFMAFFSTLWASMGIAGLQGLGGFWLTGLILLVGLALLGGGISLLVASRRLPDDTGGDEEDQAKWQRKGIWFGLVFAAEGLLIVLASVIFNRLHRIDLFYPVLALIVGIHFFPLAALFEEKIHYLAGALLCLLALVTFFAVPEQLSLGNHPITAWWVVLGFGAAFILWAVGFTLWRQGRSLLVQG